MLISDFKPGRFSEINNYKFMSSFFSMNKHGHKRTCHWDNSNNLYSVDWLLHYKAPLIRLVAVMVMLPCFPCPRLISSRITDRRGVCGWDPSVSLKQSSRTVWPCLTNQPRWLRRAALKCWPSLISCVRVQIWTAYRKRDTQTDSKTLCAILIFLITHYLPCWLHTFWLVLIQIPGHISRCICLKN